MTDLSTIQSGWDQAAREDAMWNILTEPGKAHGGWTANDFFAHGRVEIDAAMGCLGTLGLNGDRFSALDFGCGIGRLTQALANHYDRVSGVDISPLMVDLARMYNLHEDRVAYHANSEPDLNLFDGGTFDLVYSMIVLQHMPQDLQQGYVREFFRVLRPSGVAMFEIPDGPDVGHPGWWLSMYGVPQSTVEQWVEESGGRLVDVEDLGQDADWRNLRYTAVGA